MLFFVIYNCLVNRPKARWALILSIQFISDKKKKYKDSEEDSEEDADRKKKKAKEKVLFQYTRLLLICCGHLNYLNLSACYCVNKYNGSHLRGAAVLVQG